MRVPNKAPAQSPSAILVMSHLKGLPTRQPHSQACKGQIQKSLPSGSTLDSSQQKFGRHNVVPPRWRAGGNTTGKMLAREFNHPSHLCAMPRTENPTVGSYYPVLKVSCIIKFVNPKKTTRCVGEKNPFLPTGCKIIGGVHCCNDY